MNRRLSTNPIESGRAETEPDSVYGVLIDSLGARIIQTDRPGPLIRYLEARGRH